MKGKAFKAAGLFSLLWALSACSNDLKEIDRIITPAEQNQEVATNVEVVYSEDGHRRAMIRAPKVIRHIEAAPWNEFNQGVTLYTYDAEGNVESSLKARYAEIAENQQNMTARDNVEVINSKGEKLDTEELIWDQSAKKLYSTKFVKITTPDDILTGQGMESNEDFTSYKIKNLVGSVKINPEDEP